MERSAHARAILARLAARRFGRPVPPSDLQDALEQAGMTPAAAASAIDEMVSDRSAFESEGGLLPGAQPIATRAPDETASFARLHR